MSRRAATQNRIRNCVARLPHDRPLEFIKRRREDNMKINITEVNKLCH